MFKSYEYNLNSDIQKFITIIDSDFEVEVVISHYQLAYLIDVIGKLYSSKNLNVAANIALFLIHLDKNFDTKPCYTEQFFTLLEFKEYFDNVRKYLILR